MCAYGNVSQKPTKLLTNANLEALQQYCPGTCWWHEHVKMVGQVYHPRLRRDVWRTSLAQEYPARLVNAWAFVIGGQLSSWWPANPHTGNAGNVAAGACRMPLHEQGEQFSLTFGMKAGGSRKRPLGTSYERPAHKKGKYGKMALASGHQTRSSRVQPLIMTEKEPGETVRDALKMKHPLLTPPSDFPTEVLTALQAVAKSAEEINAYRLEVLAWWTKRAAELHDYSLKIISEIEDEDLRKLYTRKPLQGSKTNPFFHYALFWQDGCQGLC